MKKNMMITLTNQEEEEEESSPASLIPGLPDDVAERCLLHVPFLYHALFRSVSSTWNRCLSDPSFLHYKQKKSLHHSSCNLSSFLFAFAFHPVTSRLQWQALDPLSRRWFLLPDMPPEVLVADPATLAFAALPRRAEIYVFGPQALAVYRAAGNSWSLASLMPSRKPSGFFFAAAAAVGDKVVASCEEGNAELYDPDADKWGQVKPRRSAVAKYDVAAVEGRMFVTEGWTWPFEASPRGAVYDAGRDEWREMAKGMREGWTGSSAVVAGRMYIVAEYGEGRVKRYESERDEWRAVAGGGVPPEVRRPYAVSGEGLGCNNGEIGGGRIFVVGEGLDVGIGRLVKEEAGCDNDERIEWQVIKGPAAFHGFNPCNAQMLYL